MSHTSETALYAVLFVLNCGFASATQPVCYGELGCFLREPPFQTLPLPESPESQGIKVMWFDRANMTHIKDLKEFDADGPLPFDPNAPLIITVHGWFGDLNNTGWSAPLHQALLDETMAKNSTIIWVDWEKGSDLSGLSITSILKAYTRPASNSRVVGRWLGMKLLQWGIDLGKTHCIGYSLGAQVCAFAGQEVQDRSGHQQILDRISAIDPAAPWFAHADPTATVDIKDAAYVDVMHGSFFGLQDKIGTVDFYANGGWRQPGCPFEIAKHLQTLAELEMWLTEELGKKLGFPLSEKLTPEELFNALGDIIGCSHYRAPKYYAESIARRPQGCACSSRQLWEQGQCCNGPPLSETLGSLLDQIHRICMKFGCSSRKPTVTVGYHCRDDVKSRTNQNYYFPTSTFPPYLDAPTFPIKP